MTLVFSLLTFQTLLGALDTFWNHEYQEKLPSRRGARVELALHAAREFVYVFLFLALAWREWHGAWAVLIAGALLVEVVITSWDFVVEDRTRRLPVFERVLHTVLTLLFGVVLMLGGNIPGVTRVVSVQIYDHVEALEYAQAHWLAGGMVVFSFLVLLGLNLTRRRAPLVS